MQAQNLSRSQVGQELFNMNRMGLNQQPSSCGYCKSNASYTWGFVKDQMYPYTYQLMIERGWRRCGTYYYKPDLTKSCCKLWTHRMPVEHFQIKKDQIKTMRKFIKLINPQAQNNQIPKISQQKQNNKQIKETFKQLQPQQKHIIDQITNKIHGYITKNKDQFIQLFINQFESKQIINKFTLQGILSKLRYFPSKNSERHDAYTNYIMIIYGANKKLFKKSYKNTDFVKSIQKWVIQSYQNNLKTKDIIIGIQRSGYLLFSFKSKNNPQQLKTEQAPRIIHSQQPKKAHTKTNQKQGKPLQFHISSEKIVYGNLVIELKKAETNNENWKIYQQYCQKIHQKPQKSKGSFKNFLCLQSLNYQQQLSKNIHQKEYCPSWDQSITKKKPQGDIKKYLGCYHMNYYVNGKLIGVGVIDIVPSGLSSVYFFYDPEYKNYRLGVISSLIQIQYIRWLQLSFPQFRYYYMGFYIQNCQKMVYKSDYQPCQVLCPITYKFVTLTPQIRNQISKIQKKQIADVRLTHKQTAKHSDMSFNQDIGQYISARFQLKNNEQFLSLRQINPRIAVIILNLLRNYIQIIGKQLFSIFTWTL